MEKERKQEREKHSNKICQWNIVFVTVAKLVQKLCPNEIESISIYIYRTILKAIK